MPSLESLVKIIEWALFSISNVSAVLFVNNLRFSFVSLIKLYIISMRSLLLVTKYSINELIDVVSIILPTALILGAIFKPITFSSIAELSASKEIG